VNITAPRGVRVRFAGNRTHPTDARVQVRQSE
jgi:hypothetical protein